VARSGGVQSAAQSQAAAQRQNAELRNPRNPPRMSAWKLAAELTNDPSLLKSCERIEECIEEHGQYPAPEVKPDPGQPTFLSAASPTCRPAASAAMSAADPAFPRDAAARDRPGRDRRRARSLLPHVAPATATARSTRRSRRSCTTRSATSARDPRPKGAKGRIKTDFMWPADAFRHHRAADGSMPSSGFTC
jgi:hypothetical protein